MCQVQSCCGCMTLRQGTYASAILTIVLGVLNVLFAILAIVLVDHVTEGHEDGKEVAGYVKIIYYVIIAALVFWIVTGILVFVAIAKNSRGLLMPWIVMTSIVVAICILGILMSLASLGAIFSSVQTALTFLIQIAIIVLMIYGLICVTSFYRNDMQEAPATVMMAKV